MSIDATDERLMLAVKDGELHKLGILFERHHARLFSFFCRMSGNRTASEDLVQDVFVRRLKYRATFRNDSPFTTWMYQIARNARLQYFRKQRTETTEPDGAIPVASNGSPWASIERDAETALLQRALDELAVEKRELLVLAWHQELKYAQISEVLGIEIGAVKVRVHRAVKELREIYLRISGEKTACNAKR